MSDPVAVVRELEELFAARGDEQYGESVTMFEHCLLTAATARESGAPDALVAACLLHDVGHLLVPPDDDFGKHTHDEIGAGWVASRFPAAVSEPVRHHVAAKRYLCATEPGYYDRLSSASQYTLEKQGGPMTPEEVAEFATAPFVDDALQLRRWEDDFGKLAERPVPTFDEFRALLEALVS